MGVASKSCVDEHEYVDIAKESVSAKWSSMIAPMLPSLLMSHEASASLFATPWRGKSSPVPSMRQAALFLRTTFENDLECQENWLAFCNASLRSCLQMSAGEVLAWTYTFVVLLVTLSGATAVSSLLGLGSLVHRLYLAGCAEAFVSFLYETVCLLQDGPVAHAKAHARKKAKVFVLSIVASAVLPKNVLAAHMTSCVLFGFMEKTLKSLFRLAIPSAQFLRCVKDMGNAYASSVVEYALSAVTRRSGKGLVAQPALAPALPPALPAPTPEDELTEKRAAAASAPGAAPEAAPVELEELADVEVEVAETEAERSRRCDEIPDAVLEALDLLAAESDAGAKALLARTEASARQPRDPERSRTPAPRRGEKIVWLSREHAPRAHRRSRLPPADAVTPSHLGREEA